MKKKRSIPPSRKDTFQRRVFDVMQPPHDQELDLASRLFDIFIISLILLNVVAVALETIPGWSEEYNRAFRLIETVSIGVFSVEYMLRLWSCTSVRIYSHPILGRLKFMLTPMAIVDLAAIAPFYLPIFLPVNVHVSSTLRMLRVFRILKVVRYSDSVHTFQRVLRSKKEDLIIVLFSLGVILILSSVAMYVAENEAQPTKFSSIPAAMWWAIMTLTTIGYGDVYPITPLGKFVGACIAVLGVGMFAWPAGLLGSAFAEQMRLKRLGKDICPHCGRPMERPAGASASTASTAPVSAAASAPASSSSSSSSSRGDARREKHA